jgi:integrase
MTRWRTSATGCIRFNRDFKRLGVGRIALSSRTRNAAEFERRNAILTKLAESAQIGTLRALMDGRISIEQLVEADRLGKLRDTDLLPDLLLLQPLWQALEQTLPLMGRALQTRRRYQVSFAALRAKGSPILGDDATLKDLARVRWNELYERWGRSAADWNHVRRAVSAFLTIALGDKFHPFRRNILANFPKAGERPRVPEITPDGFFRILDEAPEALRPCYMTLVVTGMRVGEYLRCTRFSLKPEIHAVEVPGTKTGASAAAVYVAPELWKWIAAGIPCPLGRPVPPPAEGVHHDARYKRLRLAWAAACAKVGIKARLHDLRHCMGQWSVDAGVPEAKVQVALRHATPGMTRRYTISKDRREVATAMGTALRRKKTG